MRVVALTRHRPCLCLLLLPAWASCVGPGLLSDGSSVSLGSHRGGALRAAALLPAVGEGFVVPPRWRARRRSHGTDELVALLFHAARQVRRAHRQAVLGVGDLSPRGGGPTPEHLSHHSGRDVDLFLYGKGLDGRPIVPEEMIHFDAAGHSLPPPPAVTPEAPQGPAPAPQRLDVAASWALLKALVTHPEIQVQWVFLGRPIARLILAHARSAGEPRWIVERATAVLHQPSDAQSHTDHLHVRLFCDPSDRPLGCVDRGPPRWLKKSIGYPYIARPTPHLAALFGPLRRCPLTKSLRF